METFKRLITVAIIIVLFLVSLDTDHQMRKEYMPKDKRTSYSKEIVCWGDSMTFGYGYTEGEISINGKEVDISYLSYPDNLESLTGTKTYNFGIVGATSEEIAVTQGGLPVKSSYISYEIIDYGIMNFAKKHKGDILVLELGSNGGWEDYDELIAQYRAMIEYAHCKKYIIIGDTDEPLYSFDQDVVRQAEEYEDDKIGLNETKWEKALREEFGEHFINMRVFLIQNGLSITGLEASDEDAEDALKGNISQQLRSDWTHFNAYGYYAQATGVYQKGQELGYWS